MILPEATGKNSSSAINNKCGNTCAYHESRTGDCLFIILDIVQKGS